MRGTAEARLFEQASKAVVMVVTEDGFGSGTVLFPDGHILTNWHVIAGFESVALIFMPSQMGKVEESDIRVLRGTTARRTHDSHNRRIPD